MFGGAVVVLASAAKDGSFQRKLNLLSPSTMHNVDQSNGCDKSKQLSKLSKEAPIRFWDLTHTLVF